MELRLDKGLLSQIDKRAGALGMTRAAFIRFSLQKSFGSDKMVETRAYGKIVVPVGRGQAVGETLDVPGETILPTPTKAEPANCEHSVYAAVTHFGGKKTCGNCDTPWDDKEARWKT